MAARLALPQTDGPVPAGEFQAAYARAMGETELQNLVLGLSDPLGYLAYHTHDSRRSRKGFPDLVLAHERRGRLIFAELKKQTGKQSPEQVVWERVLRAIGVEYHLWRPSDWLDGSIKRVLTGESTAAGAR
jgi:VRR-NUC domain